MSVPQFVTQGHLGGYIKSDAAFPNGDPMTWCPGVWDWAIQTFNPRRVLDVGCGEGHAIRYFRDRAIEAVGIDGMACVVEAKVAPPATIYVHDFTRGKFLPYPFDLIWCCEFVEHVEARYEDNFLELFSQARVVLMTHGLPGQQGWHHVNCQPSDYWIKRINARGFVYCLGLTGASRTLAPNTHWERSGLVFVKV